MAGEQQVEVFRQNNFSFIQGLPCIKTDNLKMITPLCAPRVCFVSSSVIQPGYWKIFIAKSVVCYLKGVAQSPKTLDNVNNESIGVLCLKSD